MKPVGGTGPTHGAGELIIGNSSGEVRIDDVRAGNSNGKILIVIAECPASLPIIKNINQRNAIRYSTKILTNGTKGSADYMGRQ